MLQQNLSILLTALLIWTSGVPAFGQTSASPSLTDLVAEPYLELLEHAEEYRFSDRQLKDFQKELERDKKAEESRLKNEEKQLENRIDGLRKELDRLNKRSSRDSSEMAMRRRDLHCEISKLEEQLHAKESERKSGLPVVYDNRQAKLDLIQQWPAQEREIERAITSGEARSRRFGDVEDIGIRVLEEGQVKDIKTGEDAIKEMRSYGLMPEETENKELADYVQKLAQTLGDHSDLKIPLKVTVLQSEEINAFALPGGFLFVNTGLIEKAETESELAGVLAHEIAHVTARHGSRLMKKANIAGIIFQAAQVAAMIFTGGAVGIGTYYALQYGFFGLGMVLNLTLLGVSREFEEEADQLGVQYAWNAGYDPRGFISFFDKMASEKGYVRSASFFRTHPAFYERIVRSYGEIRYLPPKEDQILDSTAFQAAKAALAETPEKTGGPEKKRPTLRRLPQCDEEP